MMTRCKGCGKQVDETETCMCIHCLSEWCDDCELDCVCLQALNKIWDAEEAAALAAASAATAAAVTAVQA